LSKSGKGGEDPAGRSPLLIAAGFSLFASFLIRFFWEVPYSLIGTYPGDIYYVYTQHIVRQSPYPLEYPVGIYLLVGLTSRLAGTSYDSFLFANSLILAVLGISSTVLLRSLASSVDLPKSRLFLMWILSPSFIFYGLYNFDLFSTFFSVLAIHTLVSGRRGLSTIALALGTSVKIFPVLLLPLVLSGQSGTRMAQFISMFAGVWAAVNLPSMIFDFASWEYPYAWNALRPPNIDSVWYPVFELVGQWASILSVSLFLVLNVVVFSHYKMAAVTRANATRTAALPFSIFMLTNKIYSPQYHLMLLPFLPFTKVGFRLFYLFDIPNLLIVLIWHSPFSIIAMPFLVSIRHFALVAVFYRSLSSYPR